ncbi:MAG: DUF2993 domain-containing protein [Chamaesiphon sp.]
MTTKHSRIVSTVLSPACAVWLRSQVSKIEDLHLKIEGSDRQILGGHIPRISISAQHAVYQGLHLSQAQLVGESIRINLSQILKGKPLRLLEPVPVAGQLVLQEADLNASLNAPLLSTALTDLLHILLQSSSLKNPKEALKGVQISWQQVSIEISQVTLTGVLTDATGNKSPVFIRLAIHLLGSHELQLAPLDIQISLKSPIGKLESIQLDLGSEVDLEELTLLPRQVVCRGSLKVMP